MSIPTQEIGEELYLHRILESMPRVLSHLDREPFSATAGSFDRLYWAWNAIDISNMDLQRLILPLSFLYQYEAPSNPYYHRPVLLQWMEQAILYSCREQYGNGAFTQWYPNDNSVVTAGVLPHDLALAIPWISDCLREETKKQFLRMVHRAARFLLRHEERHGFNSNHQLGIAAGLLDIHALTGEAAYQRRAVSIIDRVLDRQMASGGFFEYAGADPGYHTLGLAFLAACATRHPEPRLREALAKGLKFSSHFLSSVSGNGGHYGSRGTKLLFPSGFEIAVQLGVGPDLRSVVRPLIHRDLGVTNRTTDHQNLAPILSDYVRAFRGAQATSILSGNPAPHRHSSDFFCPASTLFCFQRGPYWLRGRWNGGMVQVENTETGKRLFSSAGYSILLGRGVGFTGVLNGECVQEGNRMTFRAYAQRPTRMRQRPSLFMLLRVYQALFGRLMPANVLLKWLLARLLIFRRQRLPIKITRTLQLSPSEVVIEDHLENLTHGPAVVRHCPEGYMNFMGSARYFDGSELSAESVTPEGQAERPGREWTLAARGRLQIRYRIPLKAPLETASVVEASSP